MKVNLNKTVLAMALAGFGGMAHAAVVTQTATDYSKQYIETVAAATVVTADFTVKVSAEYKNDDVITLTFSSPLDAAYVPAASVIAVANTPGTDAVMTLGFLSKTANSVTYRVTDVNKAAGNTTIGNTLTFAGVGFTAGVLNSVTDIKATYAAAAATSGIAIDVATTNTAKVLAAKNQFSLVVTTPKSGLIELPNRTSFKAGDLDVALITTLNEVAPALRQAVTFGAVTYTLDGDFSWIKNTAAVAGLTPAVGVVTPSVGAFDVAKSSATKLVYSHNAVTPVTLTFDTVPNTAAAGVPAAAATAVGKAMTLNKTPFTISASVSYTGTATGEYVVANKEDAGKWLVDGVTVDIPYLIRGQVNGEGKYYGHIVTATNNHSAAGNVTIDLFKEDGTNIVRGLAAGSIAPRQTRGLSGNIVTALGGYEGKFNATVFIEVPAGSAQVYSAYTDPETKERAVVINSSN